MKQMMNIQIASIPTIPNIYKVSSQALIHLFNKYLLRIYFVSNVDKDSGNASVNKVDIYHYKI